MDEIDMFGIMGHQQLLARQRLEYLENFLNDTYMKAIDDANRVVRAEFDRWLSEKDEEYPDFGNIFDKLDKLKKDYQTKTS
jgi:hypothetical protein